MARKPRKAPRTQPRAPRAPKNNTSIIWDVDPYRLVKVVGEDKKITYCAEKLVGEDAFKRPAWVPVQFNEIPVLLLQVIMAVLDDGVTNASLNFARPAPRPAPPPKT